MDVDLPLYTSVQLTGGTYRAFSGLTEAIFEAGAVGEVLRKLPQNVAGDYVVRFGEFVCHLG